MKKDKSLPNNLDYEKDLWHKGYDLIAGIDDVGRGCIAGSVVCASVIMPKDVRIPRLTDSKDLNKKDLEYFDNIIKEKAIAWGIGEVSNEVIDEINIYEATRLAMKYAIENLRDKNGNKVVPDFVLVDGNMKIDVPIEQLSIVKGDKKSHTISSASVVAKLYRDNMMTQLDEQYNNVYGWKDNAGYPVKKHKDAILEYGITPYHRLSYAPVKKLLNQDNEDNQYEQLSLDL